MSRNDDFHRWSLADCGLDALGELVGLSMGAAAKALGVSKLAWVMVLLLEGQRVKASATAMGLLRQIADALDSEEPPPDNLRSPVPRPGPSPPSGDARECVGR